MKRKKVKRPFNGTRLKNQVLNVVKNPFNMIVAVSMVVLFCLIVIPLLQMIASTFTAAKGEIRRIGGNVGDFTLYYWKYLLVGKLSGATLWGPLKNSLVVGLFTVLVSVPLGSVLGWLVVRSDLPGKKLIGMLVVIPYMIPSWCKALSWLAVFRNKTSGSLGFLAGLGIPIPDWLAYGPVAIVLCMSLHYYAFSYIHVSSALRSINSELEEMGEICGANKVQILKSITLPLVLPSILSAVVMTLSKSIGTYGVAANLGSRIGYFTLATKMKQFINGGPQSVGFAMSIVLICLAAFIIFANQRLVGVRKSYATIGGKGGRSTPIGLAGWKPIITLILFIFFIVGIIMPVIILIVESCMLKEGTYSLSNFTLYYWIGEGDPNIMEGVPGIFKNSNFKLSLWNSLKLTLVNGVFGTIFGQMLGYICAKGRGKLHGRLVEQLVFIPYLIPSVAFGGIYLSMFSKPQTLFGVELIPALYGTFALLTLTSVVKHLPFASRAGTSNMLQISGELEEAATIEGAGFFKRFVKIVFPLSKGGFISGFMLIFVSIMKELDLIILIMTPKTSTLPYLAFQYQNQNCPQASNCVAIVMFSIVFLVYALANIFGDADLAKSMAG